MAYGSDVARHGRSRPFWPNQDKSSSCTSESLGYAQVVAGEDEAPRTDDFVEWVESGLARLTAELRRAISNVAIVIEDEPPPGTRLLGLYEGIPLTRRGSAYGGVLPDKITIYRGPLERLFGNDAGALRAQVEHVVLHEIAHHFGISDERLIEIERY
jgi:predicted Zn-dependent protease with MMP-like domain